MPSIEGFYPAQFGAYESAFSSESRVLGIGDGCKKPVCLKTKIVFKGLKPTRVPNMECTSKWETYERCLSQAGASDAIDVGGGAEETQTQEVVTTAPKKKPTVTGTTDSDGGFEFTTPVIIASAVFVIVLIVSLVLIFRAMSKPAPTA